MKLCTETKASSMHRQQVVSKQQDLTSYLYVLIDDLTLLIHQLSHIQDPAHNQEHNNQLEEQEDQAEDGQPLDKTCARLSNLNACKRDHIITFVHEGQILF